MAAYQRGRTGRVVLIGGLLGPVHPRVNIMRICTAAASMPGMMKERLQSGLRPVLLLIAAAAGLLVAVAAPAPPPAPPPPPPTPPPPSPAPPPPARATKPEGPTAAA